MLPRPQKRPRVKMNVRESERIELPGHLRYIRLCRCCVEDAFCDGRIEAAHVRIGSDGGTGLKPSDCYAVPLCQEHHRLQHKIGERRFWGMRKMDPHLVAESYWKLSPPAQKYRAMLVRQRR